MADSETISGLIKQRFADAVVDIKLDVLQPWVQVKPEAIVEVSRFMRDEPSLAFDFLRMIAGLDYKEELELVYVLFSYTHQHEFKIKVRVPQDKPSVSTVESVWPAANWYEREAYDLLGFHFENHSDLRRLLLPDDWEGHPLRKDYKEKDQYGGVSTSRTYLTGMPELPTHPPVSSEESKVKS